MANSYVPNAKVASGSVAGAVTIVLVWVAALLGLEIPTEVAQAITILIGFGVAYLVPEKVPGKRVKEDPLEGVEDGSADFARHESE